MILFNYQSGELLRSFEGHPMSVSGLQIIGNVLVTSCLDKLIRCYDLTVSLGSCYCPMRINVYDLTTLNVQNLHF